MTTTSTRKIADYLRSYSAYVEFWDVEAGDTHELLGSREVLHERAAELTAAEGALLRLVDERVLAKVASLDEAQGWDALMLRKAADLIRSEREAAPLKAA